MNERDTFGLYGDSITSPPSSVANFPNFISTPFPIPKLYVMYACWTSKLWAKSPPQFDWIRPAVSP